MVAFEEGMCVHQHVIQSGLELDAFVGGDWWTCMQNVGTLRMFVNKMPSQDVVTWGTMILGLVKCGQR
jgi:hypothetical protein